MCLLNFCGEHPSKPTKNIIIYSAWFIIITSSFPSIQTSQWNSLKVLYWMLIGYRYLIKLLFSLWRNILDLTLNLGSDMAPQLSEIPSNGKQNVYDIYSYIWLSVFISALRWETIAVQFLFCNDTDSWPDS